MLNGGHLPSLEVVSDLGEGAMGASMREQRRPMWTQHEKAVLRLLMREYAGVTEFDPPDIHKHPIKNEMWRLLTSRYNDHPNVRNRDTKQLRKAWENLKYRARKLGGDSKRSGKMSSRVGSDGSETTWPLDGVTLSLGSTRDVHDVEIQEGDLEDDSKSVILEEDLKSPHWVGNEDNGRKNAHTPEEQHVVGIDRIGTSEASMRSFSDNFFSSRYGSSFGTDFLTNGGRGAVLSLQPLVTSLVGGALPALLPFLTAPPTNPPFPAELMLNNPFTSTFVPQPDETPSEDSCSKEEDLNRPNSTQPQPNLGVHPWPSNPFSKCALSLPQKKLDDRGSTEPDDKTLKRESLLTDVEFDPPDVSEEAMQLNVTHLLSKKNREEQQHTATLQLLNMQMTHETAQHDIKMKVLEAQLQFWQRKLQLQKETNCSETQKNL